MCLAYIYLYFLFALVHFSYSLDMLDGWNYLNVHCRDNENSPVDWWYIYKPPSDAIPYLEFGRNFSYISSENVGRWQASQRRITSNSMLLNTLSPVSRPTYRDYLAFVVYEQRFASDSTFGSTTAGILMADEMGGVWIGHNIPGLPDLTSDRSTFPEYETANGHLIVCLSLDIQVLNKIAVSIRRAGPRFTNIRIPDNMKNLVKPWLYLDQEVSRVAPVPKKPDTIKLTTRSRSLRLLLMVRKAGQNVDLFKMFAQSNGVILDVYDRSGLSSDCKEGYGLRNINSISLKLFDNNIVYIRNTSDFARFAVSTAAHWQRKGNGKTNQYWACISSLDRGDKSKKGGIMLCVLNYYVWLSFDNLKAKEPTCDDVKIKRLTFY